MQSGSFGRYKIVEELGRGAMGVVYRATDPLIGRTVAIKVINEKYLASVGVEAGEYFERFEREAEVAGRMNHPGIVKIFDLGPNYIAMEFIEGQTLAALMRAHVKQKLSSVLVEKDGFQPWHGAVTLRSAAGETVRAKLEAVQRWRYEPATKDGVRVKVVQRAKFRFELK